jgi:hypothetical protein
MHRTTTTITIATDSSVTTTTCPSWCELRGSVEHSECQGRAFRMPVGEGGVSGYLYRGERGVPVLALHSQSEPGIDGGFVADLDEAGVDRLIDEAARFVGDLVRLRAQLLADGRR